MDNKLIYDQYLLQSLMVGYKKAIVVHHSNQSKGIIDEACFYAVEDLTQKLFDNAKIDKILGQEIDSMTKCINHHVDNLIKGEVWTEENRPIIDEVDTFEVVVRVPVCTFTQGCKDVLREGYSEPIQAFPCQTVGCLVGSIKKYLQNEVMPSDMKPDYFMTRVHEKDGCSAVIFGRHGFQFRRLIQKYSLQMEINDERK